MSNRYPVHNRASRAKGFTLIELLIVITIIAILAAILFPVFARARENARRSSCQSNLKQVGMGMEQYKNDYDGFFPPAYVPFSGSPVYAWPTLIFPYVKSEQVFVCPSAEPDVFSPNPALVNPAVGGRSRYCGVTDNDSSTASVRQVNSLSYSRNLIPNNDPSWTTSGWGLYNSSNPTTATAVAGNLAKQGFVGIGTTSSVHEAEVVDSAGAIHIMDAMTGTSSATSDPCTQGSSIRAIQEEIRTDRYPNSEASKVAPRHFDGFNILFGDGHVKWRKWGTTRAEEWSIQED